MEIAYGIVLAIIYTVAALFCWLLLLLILSYYLDFETSELILGSQFLVRCWYLICLLEVLFVWQGLCQDISFDRAIPRTGRHRPPPFSYVGLENGLTCDFVL